MMSDPNSVAGAIRILFGDEYTTREKITVIQQSLITLYRYLVSKGEQPPQDSKAN